MIRVNTSQSEAMKRTNKCLAIWLNTTTNSMILPGAAVQANAPSHSSNVDDPEAI